MNKTLKTLILVVVLAVAGYLLLPYVKTSKSTQSTSNNQTQTSAPTTFTSDDWGVKFNYLADQNGDGKADIAATESGDKIYVYDNSTAKESGQWVQAFTKDPSVSLADAVKAKFLQGISPSDCYATDMGKFFTDNGGQAPDLPANTERVIIAYPFPTDPSQPFFQNADKCPQGYSLTNGISYFQMDTAHPDKYYFFSIGQYPIFADPSTQTTWQDTFQVTK